MQNIGGENAGDAFYRYKMPKLVAKVRGLVGSMGVSCVVPIRPGCCSTCMPRCRSRAAVMASRQTW
jgi:hypothetical protein